MLKIIKISKTIASLKVPQIEHPVALCPRNFNVQSNVCYTIFFEVMTQLRPRLESERSLTP